MRIGSRLTNAPIHTNKKFPVILQKKDEHVSALIRFCHRMEMHAGPKATLNRLREKFWIVQGLQAVKNEIRKCVLCQRNFKKPEVQRMAPLPAERVDATAPFMNTGVDLAGPFGVLMNGRATHKVWIVIFTCMSTRSVHAEIVHKIDAPSMINAIVRFSARRPGVVKFFSDQGTNMRGADNILKKQMKEWMESATTELYARGLEWSFIPSHTPHYGGVWERIVALFKRLLVSVQKGNTLQLDVFNTAVIEMEAIINRRPLTAISTDPNDTEALTPAHILYPATFAHSAAVIIPENPITDADHLRCAWRRSRSRVNAFKKSFFKEYIALLHQRDKWNVSKENMKKDDLVLICDDSLARCHWKTGRIIDTEGSDDHVRRVYVRKADGSVSLHDRSKIVKLEME